MKLPCSRQSLVLPLGRPIYRTVEVQLNLLNFGIGKNEDEQSGLNLPGEWGAGVEPLESVC